MSEPVVITKARISYPNLFTPKPAFAGGDPKYSLTALIPKSAADTKARLDAAANQAYQEGTNGTWNGNPPPNPSLTLYDGDGYTPKGEAWGDECKGHWVLRASSMNPPQVLDATCKPITNQTDVYAGCYASVLVHFYAYNTAGNRGIGCGLDGIQKLTDGEPLGGKVDAKKYFTPQAQPAFGQPPQPGATPQAYQPAPPAFQPPQAPTYQPAPQAYPQPQPQSYQPQAPAYQPAPTQIDPITGRPVVGPVMGM